MPRRPRFEGEGAVHHVIPQAVDGLRLVRDDHDRRVLLDRLESVVERFEWRCLGYSVMDTHLHLVVCTPTPNLGAGMKDLTGWYAYGFNKRHQRFGHLFAGRYWSRRILTEAHLLRSVTYAALNPVAAGLCSHPSLFPWCSYARSVGDTDSGFVDTLWLRMLDERGIEDGQRAFRTFVEARLKTIRNRKIGDGSSLWNAAMPEEERRSADA
jgi:putative transposase